MGARLVAWERTDGNRGHGMGRLERTSDGWRVHGAEVVTGPGERYACLFEVALDAGWVTRQARVEAVGADDTRRLELARDAKGRWLRDGDPVPALDGCLDVDVAAAPVTNSFPTRRLADALAAGDAITVPVAWVDVPTLQVARVEQTYRRLSVREWEYSDPAYGAFRFSVDDDGLVVDYEGLARRTPA